MHQPLVTIGPGFLSLSAPKDAEWGTLHIPAEPQLASREGAVRVAIFGSYMRGFQVLQSLIRLREFDPDLMQIVGVSTDEVIDVRSKISRGRRVWQYVDIGIVKYWQFAMEALALERGIEVFTGKVKSEYFRQDVLSRWAPELILMCTMGQLIDQPIFDFPRLGMYNFHPSHLAEGKYPGPNPFEEMLSAGETTTRMTLHHVDAGFDTGKVVGFSPPINILPEEGWFPGRAPHIEALHLKTSIAAGIMARHFLGEIKERQSKFEGFFDFESCFGSEEKRLLLEPLRRSSWC